ncbi:MAG: helix-turn-helix transcriptional regulator [Bacteroidia bacterium]
MFITKDIYKTHQGMHLRNLRKEAKLSQKKLAEKLDVDRQTVNRIEKGKTNPNSYYLHNVSVCLGIPRTKVLDFEIPAPSEKS